MTVHQTLYNIIQSLPRPNGEIQPDVQTILNNHNSRNLTGLLAFPVKVGGTFLRTALISLLSKNYTTYLGRGSYACTNQSRDLYFPHIMNHYVTVNERPSCMILHCHTYSLTPVNSIIELFNIQTIVMTRNILDTLVSYWDMLNSALPNGDPIKDDFVLQTSTPYAEMSEEERRWSLVNIAPVWFSRFYFFWIKYVDDCAARGASAPLTIRYPDLCHNPEKLLAKAAAHIDPNNRYSATEIKAALGSTMERKEQYRFNKGVSGRGAKFFTKDEQETIMRLMLSHDDTYNQLLIDLDII